MKVCEADELFFTYGQAERQYAPQTLEKLRDCFAAWIVPVLGSIEIDHLTPQDLLQLRQAMFSHGLSIARQYSIITALKRFLDFCRATLHVNALDPATVALPKRPRPSPEALDNDELERVREAININTVTGLRFRALVELLSETGLRIGEALALNRPPFDHSDTEIEITGKGSKKRTVFVTTRALFWVRQYLARRCDQMPALFVTRGASPARWKQCDASPQFIKLRKDAKISKKLTAHLLRHTFCTNLRNNGADISLIRDLAGHADISTTARYYLKTDKAALREAVRKYLNYRTSHSLRRAA